MYFNGLKMQSFINQQLDQASYQFLTWFKRDTFARVPLTLQEKNQ